MLYKDWMITSDPKPIPTTKFDVTAVHRDYDGYEDNRCFATSSIYEAKKIIDEEYPDD